MNLVEEQFGHGALVKKYDIRDHKVSQLGMTPLPFDWAIGFDITSKVRSIITENQGQSSSCGGQAARYYLSILNALETGTYTRLSAKDPYCQIFYPGGGTTIRDIGNVSVKFARGIRSEALIPSYENNNPPSEWFMEDTSLTTSAPLQFFRASAYAFTKTDMESIAQAIRDNNGCIIEINGQNNGTWLMTYPQPPQTTQWRHFLYAGKAIVRNGEKLIGILNSWGSEVGENGWQYLGENYFNGNVTNGMIFYDSNLIPHTPSTIQSTTNSLPAWVVKLINWLGNYLH